MDIDTNQETWIRAYMEQQGRIQCDGMPKIFPATFEEKPRNREENIDSIQRRLR
jgi:hypothetical protein